MKTQGEVLITVDGAPLDWRSSLAVRNPFAAGGSACWWWPTRRCRRGRRLVNGLSLQRSWRMRRRPVRRRRTAEAATAPITSALLAHLEEPLGELSALVPSGASASAGSDEWGAAPARVMRRSCASTTSGARRSPERRLAQNRVAALGANGATRRRRNVPQPVSCASDGGGSTLHSTAQCVGLIARPRLSRSGRRHCSVGDFSR